MIPVGWKSRTANLLFWTAPILFLFSLFLDGLSCWFVDDDFAWLGLIRELDRPHGLLLALFEPAAQGTIRPLSDRGFFLLFESLFGMDNLPFRIMAFATMAVNLLLLTWVVRRMTGSRLAGLIAGMCWAANTALVTVMTWSSAYNQAMCGCFMLGALALLIRYVETGKRRYWWWQLVVFSLGFGALEINVVYPALAAAYLLFVAPKEKRGLLTGVAPLAAISVVYFFIHRAVAPLPTAGVYAIHLDTRILRSLVLYGKWSLLPEVFGHSRRLGKLILWTSIFAIAGLLFLESRKRRATVLFFVTWYVASLAPVLVLPEHRSDYYLTIPLIGLAMLFAFGATCAVRDYRAWRFLALIPLAGYFFGMIPASRSATQWRLKKTEPVRALVLGVEAAREHHPGKAILLDGIPAAVYDHSMAQSAFYPLDISDVYLTPGLEAAVSSGPDRADPETAFLDPAAAFHAVANNQVVVYTPANDHLRNVTEAFRRSASSRFSDLLPRRLDAGNPLYSWLLGPAWSPPESGVRWMPGEATVRLRGPESRGANIVLDGFCPPEQLKSGSRHLLVSVDGVRVGETQIRDPESNFHRLFLLPDASAGKSVLNIEIRVDPVTHNGGQEFGLVFGKIAVRP